MVVGAAVLYINLIARASADALRLIYKIASLYKPLTHLIYDYFIFQLFLFVQKAKYMSPFRAKRIYKKTILECKHSS